MPCYVRFHTREYLEGLSGNHYDPNGNLQDPSVSNCLNPQMLDICDEQEWHQVDCELFSTSSFYYDGWNWYGRWVAEWGLDGTEACHTVPIVPTGLEIDETSPVIQEPTALKKPKVSKVSPKATRTITLESVDSTGKQCGLCFYKGFKCYTSECNRRYWKLIETVDQP